MILTLVQQNESFDPKLFQEKPSKLLSGQLTVESFDWCLCKRFDNFYIKWIQIYRKTGLQGGYLSIPQHDYYISMAKLLSTFQNVFQNFIFLWFVIRNVKSKLKTRHSIHFLAQQKQPLNKQNSLTCYCSTYLRFLEAFLVTTTTTQRIRFHK